MTNHPNRSRTYWYLSSRGFANEYLVGIATSRAAADQYWRAGYERISRERALREMTNAGDEATKIYCGVSVDHDEAGHDRFETARHIREGWPVRAVHY